MKREDQVKKVVGMGAMIKSTVPVEIKAVKKRSSPVRVGRQMVDRDHVYLRLKLPTGHFVDCKVEGKLSEDALTEALAKDPYFKPFFQVLNPKKEDPPPEEG